MEVSVPLSNCHQAYSAVRNSARSFTGLLCLFDDSDSSFDCTMYEGRVINECRNGRDMEGSDPSLTESIIAWREWGKRRNLQPG